MIVVPGGMVAPVGDADPVARMYGDDMPRTIHLAIEDDSQPSSAPLRPRKVEPELRELVCAMLGNRGGGR